MQIESAQSAKDASDAAKLTAKWTRYSAIFIALTMIITAIGLFKSLPSRTEKPPQQSAFEKRFEQEALLVKTCPGDPRYASGPTAITVRIFELDKKLWYEDVDGYHTVAASPETVCDILGVSK